MENATCQITDWKEPESSMVEFLRVIYTGISLGENEID